MFQKAAEVGFPARKSPKDDFRQGAGSISCRSNSSRSWRRQDQRTSVKERWKCGAEPAREIGYMCCPNRTERWGYSMPFASRQWHHKVQVLDMELYLVFSLLGMGFPLAQSFPAILPIPSIQNGNIYSL